MRYNVVLKAVTGALPFTDYSVADIVSDQQSIFSKDWFSLGAVSKKDHAFRRKLFEYRKELD